MDISAIKKIVGNIKSNLFKNSNSYSIGMLKSHFKGFGLQFKEHQIYAHGDDVRFIDWKILAKTQTPFIKTFEEERNVEIAVLIDASPTMLLGYNNISKLEASFNLTCLLYLLADETSDYVHVTIISSEIKQIPKMNGDKGIAHLIAVMFGLGLMNENGIFINKSFESIPPEQEKIHSLMKHFYRRREIVVLSDFNEFLPAEVIGQIINKSNVHCFKIISPLDEAKSHPFKIFSKSDCKSDKGRTTKLDLGNTRIYDDVLNKQYKKLKVHERYMENFIKEML